MGGCCRNNSYHHSHLRATNERNMVKIKKIQKQAEDEERAKEKKKDPKRMYRTGALARALSNTSSKHYMM